MSHTDSETGHPGFTRNAHTEGEKKKMPEKQKLTERSGRSNSGVRGTDQYAGECWLLSCRNHGFT